MHCTQLDGGDCAPVCRVSPPQSRTVWYRLHNVWARKCVFCRALISWSQKQYQPLNSWWQRPPFWTSTAFGDGFQSLFFSHIFDAIRSQCNPDLFYCKWNLLQVWDTKTYFSVSLIYLDSLMICTVEAAFLMSDASLAVLPTLKYQFFRKW